MFVNDPYIGLSYWYLIRSFFFSYSKLWPLLFWVLGFYPFLDWTMSWVFPMKSIEGNLVLVFFSLFWARWAYSLVFWELLRPFYYEYRSWDLWVEMNFIGNETKILINLVCCMSVVIVAIGYWCWHRRSCFLMYVLQGELRTGKIEWIFSTSGWIYGWWPNDKTEFPCEKCNSSTNQSFLLMNSLFSITPKNSCWECVVVWRYSWV